MSKIDEAVEQLESDCFPVINNRQIFNTSRAREILTALVEPSIPEDMERAIEEITIKINALFKKSFDGPGTAETPRQRRNHLIREAIRSIVAPLVAENERLKMEVVDCKLAAQYGSEIFDHATTLQSRLHDAEKEIADLRSRLDRAEKALGEIAEHSSGYADVLLEWPAVNFTHNDMGRYFKRVEYIISLARQGLEETTADKTFPEIITLCGSTKFKEEYLEAQKMLTLDGRIVISVGLFGHADSEPISESQKDALDELHKRKIDIADAIYVINVGGYIGDSTKSEIEYAKRHGKSIYYLESARQGLATNKEVEGD